MSCDELRIDLTFSDHLSPLMVVAQALAQSLAPEDLPTPPREFAMTGVSKIADDGGCRALILPSREFCVWLAFLAERVAQTSGAFTHVYGPWEPLPHEREDDGA